MVLPDGSGVKILRAGAGSVLPIKVAILFSSADPRGMLDEVNHLRAMAVFCGR